MVQARLDGSHGSVAFDGARGGTWGSIASDICRGEMKFQLCLLCLISQRSSLTISWVGHGGHVWGARGKGRGGRPWTGYERDQSFTSNFDTDLDKILYTHWVVLKISKALSGSNFLGF